MPIFLNGPLNPKSKLRPLIPVVMQPNMTSRKLRSQTAYYWRRPRSAKTYAMPLHAEPLGSDFVAAVIRAIKLNAIYADCKKAKQFKSN